MKNYKHIQDNFRTLNSISWAGVTVYNLQPESQGGTEV